MHQCPGGALAPDGDRASTSATTATATAIAAITGARARHRDGRATGRSSPARSARIAAAKVGGRSSGCLAKSAASPPPPPADTLEIPPDYQP